MYLKVTEKSWNFMFLFATWFDKDSFPFLIKLCCNQRIHHVWFVTILPCGQRKVKEKSGKLFERDWGKPRLRLSQVNETPNCI